MKPLKIGEVAKETGLSVKAIRFYEKKGLIPRAERTFSSGYRLYTEGDFRRLRLIQRFKLLGLRLSQVKEIVASLKGEGCDCKRVKPHLHRLVSQQLQDIEKKMQELNHLRGELQKILKRSNKIPLPHGFCLCSEIPYRPMQSRPGLEIFDEQKGS